MAEQQYVYGATEASTYIDGVRVVIHVDEPWPADDPAVVASRKLGLGLFNDTPFDARGTVRRPEEIEQATRRPGERSRARAPK